MKTTTYLRLSLLIPFLVWAVCLLFFIIWSRIDAHGPETNGANIISGLILWSVLFYVFGIIGWFLPYLLLSLTLLVWSFRSRAQVLIRVFALSPVAMTILIVIFMSILSVGSQDWNMFSSNPATDFENFFGSSLWFAIITLLWGYICVAIGFGIYKLLQRVRIIRDGEPIALAPGPIM